MTRVIFLTKLICPVCSEALSLTERSHKCINNHSFDIAKEGYVNLLTGNHKDGSLIGDNKEMAKSRKAFLEKGYFDPLKSFLVSYINENTEEDFVIADICCGEGYYSHCVKEETGREVCGFDISKEMVKLSAKRKNGNTYFVANLSKIPLETGSVDLAFHLFAPFQEKEFSRILKENGTIITVVSGENHLFELKEILYDTPYKNDEKPPETEKLCIAEKIKITEKVLLKSKEDIDALFRMTPYYYHTKPEDKKKLEGIESLEVTLDFAVYCYQK